MSTTALRALVEYGEFTSGRAGRPMTMTLGLETRLLLPSTIYAPPDWSDTIIFYWDFVIQPAVGEVPCPWKKALWPGNQQCGSFILTPERPVGTLGTFLCMGLRFLIDKSKCKNSSRNPTSYDSDDEGSRTLSQEGETWGQFFGGCSRDK